MLVGCKLGEMQVVLAFHRSCSSAEGELVLHRSCNLAVAGPVFRRTTQVQLVEWEVCMK